MDLAREPVLTPIELKSALAERPYDLRHARLSLWLNSGVDPAQISEWAGNSVAVLLRVYIHCLADSQESALAKLGRQTSRTPVEIDLSELDRLLVLQVRETLSAPEPVSVYDLAVPYTAEKRKTVKPVTMKGAIETLTKVTVATLPRTRPWPPDTQLGKALTSWAFSDQAAPVPDNVAKVLAWVAAHSEPVSILKNPDRLRGVLGYLGRRLDGEPASANVSARRRSALFNYLDFAVAGRHLPTNPLLFHWWDS